MKNATFFKALKSLLVVLCLGYSMPSWAQHALTSVNASSATGDANYTATSALRNTNIFVDASLPDAHILQQAVSYDTENLHIFSHGKPGELFIEGQWLSGVSLQNWLTQKVAGQNYQAINIYGCEFAKGAEGLKAVEWLEQQIGMPIAASTNITGIDGDWTLEAGNHTNTIFISNYESNLQCTGGAADCDGDGVPNNVDLDDDNDGILDNSESPCENFALARWTHNNTGYNATINPPIIASAPAYTIGSGLGRTIISTSGLLTGVNQANFNNAVSANDYAQHRFTTQAILPAGFVYEVIGFTLRNPGYNQYGSYRVTMLASNDGFATSTVIVNNVFRPVNPSGTFYPKNTNNEFFLNPNSTYTFRLYVYSASTSSVTYDDISIDVCRRVDTDGDGIANYRDTDSDNDGCPDAIEGGAAFTFADLDGNNSLLGGVGANGVPLVAGGGQSIGQSQIATTAAVTTAPVNQVVAAPAAASFNVVAQASNGTGYTGTAPNTVPVYGTPGNANGGLQYQWYLDDPDNGGVALSNAGVYSGVTTATLNISNTSGLIGNEYFVVVTHTNQACFRDVESAFLLLTCSVSAPSSSPVLCVNTAMTDITHTTTSATGIGAPTGLPPGVSASWSANVITISGTPTSIGVYNYSIPLTGGTCTNQTATGTITVEPLLTASTAGGSVTICEDESATVSGATASSGTILWTSDGNGTLTDETTLTPTYTAVSADGGNVVTLTMTVTSNNACGTATATDTYSINVTTVPVLGPVQRN